MPHRANAQEATTMWYIGIDVHKKMCNACIKDLDGNIQKELDLNSQRRALEQTSYLMLLTEEKQKQ